MALSDRIFCIAIRFSAFLGTFLIREDEILVSLSIWWQPLRLLVLLTTVLCLWSPSVSSAHWRKVSTAHHLKSLANLLTALGWSAADKDCRRRRRCPMVRRLRREGIFVHHEPRLHSSREFVPVRNFHWFSSLPASLLSLSVVRALVRSSAQRTKRPWRRRAQCRGLLRMSTEVSWAAVCGCFLWNVNWFSSPVPLFLWCFYPDGKKLGLHFLRRNLWSDDRELKEWFKKKMRS